MWCDLLHAHSNNRQDVLIYIKEDIHYMEINLSVLHKKPLRKSGT